MSGLAAAGFVLGQLKVFEHLAQTSDGGVVCSSNIVTYPEELMGTVLAGSQDIAYSTVAHFESTIVQMDLTDNPTSGFGAVPGRTYPLNQWRFYVVVLVAGNFSKSSDEPLYSMPADRVASDSDDWPQEPGAWLPENRYLANVHMLCRPDDHNLTSDVRLDFNAQAMQTAFGTAEEPAVQFECSGTFEAGTPYGGYPLQFWARVNIDQHGHAWVVEGPQCEVEEVTPKVNVGRGAGFMIELDMRDPRIAQYEEMGYRFEVAWTNT